MGCATAADTHALQATNASRSPRQAARVTVQSDPLYGQARSLYGARDYAGALHLLTALRDQSGRTPDDTAFLDRQIAICRRALGNPAQTATQTAARASGGPDCGARALAIACEAVGVRADVRALTRAAGTTARGASMAGVARAARQTGLTALGVQVDRNALAHVVTPAIAWVDGGHYIVVRGVHGATATVRDPNDSGDTEIAVDDLLRRSGGILLELGRAR